MNFNRVVESEGARLYVVLLPFHAHSQYDTREKGKVWAALLHIYGFQKKYVQIEENK